MFLLFVCADKWLGWHLLSKVKWLVKSRKISHVFCDSSRSWYHMRWKHVLEDQGLLLTQVITLSRECWFYWWRFWFDVPQCYDDIIGSGGTLLAAGSYPRSINPAIWKALLIFICLAARLQCTPANYQKVSGLSVKSLIPASVIVACHHQMWWASQCVQQGQTTATDHLKCKPLQLFAYARHNCDSSTVGEFSTHAIRAQWTACGGLLGWMPMQTNTLSDAEETKRWEDWGSAFRRAGNEAH